MPSIYFDLMSMRDELVPDGYVYWAERWAYRVSGLKLVTGGMGDNLKWMLVGDLLAKGGESALVEDVITSGDLEGLYRAGGQFWLVILNRRPGVMEIIRDRTGVMPLSYAQHNNRIAFSTSVGRVIESLQLARGVELQMLNTWPLYRKTFAPVTPYSEVESLSGEHTISVERDTIQAVANPLGPRHAAVFSNIHETLEGIDAALKGATRKRLSEECRYGVLLSGGTDSSLVVAMIREYYKEQLNTLFVTFSDYSRDYGRYAAVVANTYGTNHDTLRINAQDYARAWPHTIKTLQTPVPMPCHVGFSLAMRHLAGSVDVLIDGDGADTVFGSPVWPQLALLSALGSVLPSEVRNFLLRSSSRSFYGSKLGTILKLALQAGGTPLRLYPHTAAAMLDERAFDSVFAAGHWREGMLFRSSFAEGPFLDGIFTYLFLHGISEDIVTAVRIAYEEGIRFTYPFLDHHVLNTSLRIPNRIRWHLWTRKFPLKRYALKYFDREFVFKPKEGFGVPLGRWFATKEFEHLLALPLEHRSLRRGWWHEGPLRAVITEHQKGMGSDQTAERVPWIAANLELWARICLDGDRPEQYT